MNRHLIAAGLAVLAASAFGASDGVVHADVVIYGSSPAAISAAGGSPVQDVPYATLRKRLVADGQVIELAPPVLAAEEKKAGGLHLDEISESLKSLRTWALPYAAGVPYEAFALDGAWEMSYRPNAWEAEERPKFDGVRILKEETVKSILAVSTRPKGFGGYSLGLSAPEVDDGYSPEDIIRNITQIDGS